MYKTILVSIKFDLYMYIIFTPHVHARAGVK